MPCIAIIAYFQFAYIGDYQIQVVCDWFPMNGAESNESFLMVPVFDYNVALED